MFAYNSQLHAGFVPDADQMEEATHPAVWKIIEKEDKFTPPGAVERRGSAVVFYQDSGRILALSGAHCFIDSNHWSDEKLWFLRPHDSYDQIPIRMKKGDLLGLIVLVPS